MASTGNATLQGVTISARQHSYTSDNGITTTLLGTIDNLGTIEQIGGNGAERIPVHRQCGHAHRRRNRDCWTPSQPTAAARYIEGNGQTLTNTNNTIQGTGVIGNGNLVLINEGLIDATPESGTAR